MKETWKEVPGYEGYYWVSDLGRIKGRRKGILKTPRPQNYKMVNFYKNGKHKTFLVHKVVLMTFVGPRPPKMEACHLDGNPANNKLSNLRWDTDKVNTSHRKIHGRDTIGERHGSAKLTEKQVLEIRELYRQGYALTTIANHYGISRWNTESIVKRRTWKHI